MTDTIVANVDIEKAKALAEAVAPVVGQDHAIAVVEAVNANPVLTNTLSMEPWYQSGVGFFAAGGVGFASVVLAFQVVTHGTNLGAYDWPLVTNQVTVLGAFAAVLYRRFASGLKPMFHSVFGG